MRVFLAAAFLMSAAFAGVPAKAAGASICQVQATVTLTTVENLLAVNGGEGTMSGAIVCEGSINGAATNFSGNFSFCMHKGDGGHDNPIVSGPNPTQRRYCTDLSAQQPTNNVHSNAALVAQTATGGSSVVAHVNAALSFTAGGITCNFGLLGHSDLVLAELNLTGFVCTNGFGHPSAEIARAQALAAIRVDPTLTTCTAGPGGAKACFQLLSFGGAMEIVDQT